MRALALALLPLVTGTAPKVMIRDMFVDGKGRVLFESTDHARVYFGDASGVYQLAVMKYCASGEHHSVSFPEGVGPAVATFSLGEGGGHLACSTKSGTFRHASPEETSSLQVKLTTGSWRVFPLGSADRIPRYLFRVKGEQSLI